MKRSILRQRLAATGPVPVLLVILGAAFLALHAGPAARAQTPVIQQQTTAQLNWKRAFEKDAPPSAETARLLLYGTVPGKTLKEVGEVLEKQFELAYTALKVDGKRDMWTGKLTVYLIPERPDYAKFIRRVEKRYPEEGESGTAVVRSDEPHVVAGPGQAATDSAVDAQAGEQVAAALLKKKIGAEVPSWVLQGFGRATVVQSLPAAQRTAEYRHALQLVTQKKHKAADAWGAGVEPTDAPVLRGSVLAYMAYSGRTSKFLPFLMAFRPQEERKEPTTATALQAAEISPDNLHRIWVNWLRTAK